VPRSNKRTIVIRKDILNEDEWTKDVGPHQVTCNGCKKKIKLDKQKRYATRPWDAHKEKCPAITGKKKFRSALPKHSVAGVSHAVLGAKREFYKYFLAFANRLKTDQPFFHAIIPASGYPNNSCSRVSRSSSQEGRMDYTHYQYSKFATDLMEHS
jgi:hypothetical protein